MSSAKKNLWHWRSTKTGSLLALLVNVIQSWITYRFFEIDASAMAISNGAVAVFIFLVDYRDDRFLKGFFLIAYGVMIQFSCDLVFKQALEGSHWADNVRMLLMITIGSTRAGGSLIATRSYRSSTDLDSNTISPMVRRLSVNSAHSNVTCMGWIANWTD
ncbi:MULTISPECIES: hypothetical protein [Pseudomonas]|uniref:hypothetical protein n=1 Tax=Pseudomonas TaxID=286 RepID=UPI000CD3576A|nr:MULTISPECIES: hypothetical protein [Pseudomonas]MCA5973865.1 hypothetical protein [Pseudomonas sp. P135]MCH5516504.1 hypothetical protein [Pseudomonas syringae pv. syringae]MCH5535926.1 hypothetical protein [Pseudomonas syringae pv. syringae]MCH5553285.1 hypothetical protein [Pseudomonas syringae pv. syringae]MCH5572110.1 hypothetical protein [Pseudomonas syringae pv. syringae]